MSVKPILFSGPMVRALLDGRKSQTRRVVKISDHLTDETFTGDLVNYYGDRRLGMVVEGSTLVQPIPYAPGDLLWVREAHYLTNKHAYRLSVGVEQTVNPADDYEACVYKEGFDRSTGGLRSRPSIHMPRWASRLTLRVTDVRVQRVQKISAEDARDEGVNRRSTKVRQFDLFGADAATRDRIYLQACKWEFEDLWDSLNARRGFSWEANPWVVALTFDVIRQNVDEVAR